MPPVTYLITGASRELGLGLGYAKHLLEQEGTLVVLTAREPSPAMEALSKKYPGRVLQAVMDTTDEASIEAAVKELTGKLPHGLDYLINNAGVIGDEGFISPLDVTKQQMLDTFTTNTVGTFLVTKAFLPLLKLGTKKTIVNISSGLGSIGMVQKSVGGGGQGDMAGRLITYRQSKAALNMQGAVLANALKPEGFTVLSLCPGWVQTDMGNGAGEYHGSKPTWTTEESTKRQLQVIHGLKPEDSGKFLTLTGEAVLL